MSVMSNTQVQIPISPDVQHILDGILKKHENVVVPREWHFANHYQGLEPYTRYVLSKFSPATFANQVKLVNSLDSPTANVHEFWVELSKLGYMVMHPEKCIDA